MIRVIRPVGHAAGRLTESPFKKRGLTCSGRCPGVSFRLRARLPSRKDGYPIVAAFRSGLLKHHDALCIPKPAGAQS